MNQFESMQDELEGQGFLVFSPDQAAEAGLHSLLADVCQKHHVTDMASFWIQSSNSTTLRSFLENLTQVLHRLP